MGRHSEAGPLRGVSPGPSRLETAALVGDGIVLAANAGFANVIVFLSVFRQSVTHMTGRARNLGFALERLDWGLVGVSVALIMAFAIGCALSALLVPDRDLAMELPYGRIFLIESLLLTGAATLLISDIEAGIYLAALSFGMQNGKATFYEGVVIRTSHITGIVTDLGVDLGLLLRRRRVPSATVFIKLGVLVGFVGGGVLGAMAFRPFGVGALYISAVFTLAVALLEQQLRRRKLRSATTG
ncbi:MAG: YoaK family protein [Acidimicrobiales bacterium]